MRRAPFEKKTKLDALGPWVTYRVPAAYKYTWYASDLTPSSLGNLRLCPPLPHDQNVRHCCRRGAAAAHRRGRRRRYVGDNPPSKSSTRGATLTLTLALALAGARTAGRAACCCGRRGERLAVGGEHRVWLGNDRW